MHGHFRRRESRGNRRPAAAGLRPPASPASASGDAAGRNGSEDMAISWYGGQCCGASLRGTEDYIQSRLFVKMRDSEWARGAQDQGRERGDHARAAARRRRARIPRARRAAHLARRGRGGGGSDPRRRLLAFPRQGRPVRAMCERATLPLDGSLDDARAAEHDDPLESLREPAHRGADGIWRPIRARRRSSSSCFTDARSHRRAGAARGQPSSASAARASRASRTSCARAVAAGRLPPRTPTRARRARDARLRRGIMQDVGARARPRTTSAAAAPALVDAIARGLASPRRPRVRRSRASGATALQAERDAVGK